MRVTFSLVIQITAISVYLLIFAKSYKLIDKHLMHHLPLKRNHNNQSNIIYDMTMIYLKNDRVNHKAATIAIEFY